MWKRIPAMVTLLGGLALVGWSILTVVIGGPRHPEVEGMGLAYLAEFITKYGLRVYFLIMAVGLSLCLTSVALFLMPLRRRVTADADASAQTPSAAEATTQPPVAFVAESADLIRIFRSRMLGTAFCNPGGRNRQLILREAKVGDVVTCRPLGDRTMDEYDAVGIFSVKGEQMGLMDTALFYSICEQYPHHRMGIIVERVNGGQGIPYECCIRVSIYRS